MAVSSACSYLTPSEQLPFIEDVPDMAANETCSTVYQKGFVHIN